MRISLQKLFIKNHWTLLQDFINLKKMKTCNSIRTRGKQPLEIATCSIANQCIKLVPFFFFWIIELAHQKFRVWGLGFSGEGDPSLLSSFSNGVGEALLGSWTAVLASCHPYAGRLPISLRRLPWFVFRFIVVFV